MEVVRRGSEDGGGGEEEEGGVSGGIMNLNLGLVRKEGKCERGAMKIEWIMECVLRGRDERDNCRQQAVISPSTCQIEDES